MRSRSTSRPLAIELIYFEAGGGHRSAMEALAASLRAADADIEVRATNLQQLLISIDPVYQAAGVPTEQVYNTALRRGWTRASRPLLRGLQRGIRLRAPLIRRELTRHWRHHVPDVLVSLVPNFNGVMLAALRGVSTHTPYVTVMTDMADAPPHFWHEPQDQFMVCGTARSFMQAHLAGYYRPERIIKTSGMIINPRFYAPADAHSPARQDLGLESDVPTALIMFGGNGSDDTLPILAALRSSATRMQAIVMCGRNERLLRTLAGVEGCHAVPFTDRVADFMRLADFYIGKPGPGSISEAIHMGLPVIVECNGRTLVQERYNATWIEENGYGLGLGSLSNVPAALRYLMAGDRLAEYQKRVRLVRNTAVFEVAEILIAIATGGGRRTAMDGPDLRAA